MITKFKNYKNFNTDFKAEDNVICIDDSGSDYQLKYGEEYIVKTQVKKLLVLVNQPNWWSKLRFIKKEDFADYKVELSAIKYNL